MPLENGAGHSGDTALKQHDFGYVLSVMLPIAHTLMQRDYAFPEFLYFDLNAGPGIVNGIEGSPLIFARAARDLGLPFRAYLFEKNKESALRLGDALDQLWSAADAGPKPFGRRQQFTVVIGDHNESVPIAVDHYLSKVPTKWTYGLVYGDGNGKTDAPFGPMAELADRFPRVDQLLNVNATIYKRLRGANPDAGYVLDDLAAIKKSRRLIREPVGIHQWTMIFQTNWDRAPEFGQLGFHRIDSDEGRRIAASVNFRKPERLSQEQARLPLGVALPTDRMPSTSGILASSPFAPSSSSGVAASASGATPLAQPSPIT